MYPSIASSKSSLTPKLFVFISCRTVKNQRVGSGCDSTSCFIGLRKEQMVGNNARIAEEAALYAQEEDFSWNPALNRRGARKAF